MDSNYLFNIPLFEGYCKQNNIDGIEIDCKVGLFPFKLKVASTPQSLMRGYQNSKNPPSNNEGILFVYPEPIDLSFWMKDVKFPLDIMFFDSDRQFAGYDTMEPSSYPRPYISSKPCQYAIETKAGWCNENISDINKLKLTF